MTQIRINDVRTVLANMGNTYVNSLTNEELNKAILQDYLGLQDHEVVELLEELEKNGRFFIEKPAQIFLKNTNSIPVYLLRQICKDYASESKPCYS